MDAIKKAKSNAETSQGVRARWVVQKRQVFMATAKSQQRNGNNCSQQRRVNYFRFTFLHFICSARTLSHPHSSSTLTTEPGTGPACGCRLPPEALSKTAWHIIYAIFMIIHYERGYAWEAPWVTGLYRNSKKKKSI